MKDLILEKGYHIIENFFDADKLNLVGIVNTKLDEVIKLTGNLTTRYYSLFGAIPALNDLILSSGIVDIARDVLGQNINISDLQTLTLHPGAPPINAHIDYPFLLMDKPFLTPIVQLQTLWALDDFTNENGATRIVPYSHLRCEWPTQEEFEEKCQKVLLKKGSIIIFHGALWHDTSANISDMDRSSLLLSFCPPWIKPLMQVDRETRKKLPLPIRELLGDFHLKLIREKLKYKQRQEYNRE